MFDLSGKVAVVTGGNSGIGLGMARGLAEAGADVCVWGTNEDKNRAAAEALTAIRPSSVAMRVDVSDTAAVEEGFAAVAERFGPVTAVFANAGVSQSTIRFVDSDPEEWRRTFAVNLEGAFATVREGVKQMVQAGAGGSVVVTSSLSARLGMPRGEAYSATKAGVIGLAQSVAVEFGRHGIRANVVMPGWIRTPMTEDLLGNERFDERNLVRVPLGRYGEPDDFAGIAVYLASDASRYHTGDVICIDGGYGRT